MNIAEKVLLLKQDFDYVHNKGYDDGKNSVVDYLKYANNVSLNPSCFTEENVVFNLDNAITMKNFWYAETPEHANKTVKHLTVNCKNKITSLEYGFSSAYAFDTVLEHLTLNADVSNSTTFRRTFGNLRAVKIIDGIPLDCGKCTNFYGNVFQNCYALEYVRFKANTIRVSISFAQSDLLSTETIQSIIDGLADLTGGTAQTLTLHSTVGGKLTDEQKATITAKNWILAY